MSDDTVILLLYPILAGVLSLLATGLLARFGKTTLAWICIGLIALGAVYSAFSAWQDHGWGQIGWMFYTGYFVIGLICALIGLAIGTAMRERRQGPSPEA